MSPFIELGVGLQPRPRRARQRPHQRRSCSGCRRREARERFDAIIEFAELEEFVDLKLKNYSSGMQVRLAFAVMVQVDADVLLIDEVLAVGDAAFQQKCFDVFHRLRDEGRTILLRDPRHGRGRALLRPGDAARARAHLVDRRRPSEVGAQLHASSTSTAPQPTAGRRIDEAGRRGPRRDRGRVVRGRRRRTATSLPQGEDVRRSRCGRVPRRRGRPDLRLAARERRALPRCSRRLDEWIGERTGRFGAGRRGRRSA